MNTACSVVTPPDVAFHQALHCAGAGMCPGAGLWWLAGAWELINWGRSALGCLQSGHLPNLPHHRVTAAAVGSCTQAPPAGSCAGCCWLTSAVFEESYQALLFFCVVLPTQLGQCVHAVCQHVVGAGLFLGAVKLVVSMQDTAQGLAEVKPRWKPLSKFLVKGTSSKGCELAMSKLPTWKL